MAKRYSYCIYHETLFIYTVTTTFFFHFYFIIWISSDCDMWRNQNTPCVDKEKVERTLN